MPNLTDYIEDYLKKLLSLSSTRFIEIRRAEVAGKFSCVPSQINYVLERRFNVDRGYLVESRRGGGGCIRIYRLEPEKTSAWQKLTAGFNEDIFDNGRLGEVLLRFVEEKMISRREAALLQAIVDQQLFADTGLKQEEVKQLQRKVFTAALRELLKSTY